MFISIDYASALLQAKKLENTADECAEILQCIEKQLSAIEDTWEGSAAEAYKAKLNELKQQNIKLQNEIRGTAASIKDVARIIKEADEAAASNSEVSSSGRNHGGGGSSIGGGSSRKF
ncbi:MAG: WXG100 family type VII secretion target [Clostridia bacterium]|nr:WXG100 family type VII secretion target [Clostridia bacterium]